MCCSIDTRISRLTQSPSKFKISATYFVVFFNTSNIAFIEAQTRNSICGSNGLLSQEFYLVNRVSAEGLIEPKSPHNTSHQNRLPKADLETALYCGSCCTRGHPAETLEERGLTT